MNFQMNPQTLAQLNGVPVDMTLESMDWLNQARQADQAGLADMMSANAHSAAMRPMQQEQQRLGNETTLAQLPGLRAQSDMQVRKNQGEAITFPDEIKQKLTGFAIKATADELTQLEQQGEKLMQSSDPAERRRGEAILQAGKMMFAEKIKHQQAMEKEREETRRAESVATIGANSRQAVANARGGGKSPEQILASMGFEKASVYYDAKAEAAEEAGDYAGAENYRAQSNKMKQAYERARILSAQAAQGGKVDTGALANVPTRPVPQPQGFDNKAPTQAPKTYTMDQLKARYPGVDEAKLRQAAAAKGIEIK